MGSSTASLTKDPGQRARATHGLLARLTVDQGTSHGSTESVGLGERGEAGEFVVEHGSGGSGSYGVLPVETLVHCRHARR